MIYINGRFLLQEQTGVNRFAYELCLALAVRGRDFVLLCPHGEIKECYDVSLFSVRRCGAGQSHIWEQLFLPFSFHCLRGRNILINFTGIGPILVRNKIMTIHDLAFIVNPKWYSSSYTLLYKMLTPISAITSKKILTVSEFSKSEIMRLLSVSEDKIAIVYNAVSSVFHRNTDEKIKSPVHDKYILAVSSIDPRKNFITLLKAFTLMDDPNVKLYIVGGQASIYSTSIDELFSPVSNDRIKWMGRVSDAKLKEYYSNAVCFVYPSLYEGFGIPPLEAMSCGTPTIVSDIPPIREVCRDAALYVNPLDERDVAEKMTLLVSDTALQEKLRCAGYERCKSFDWGKSADVLFDVLKSI